MATAVAPLSIETYLRTSYEPDADFVDGELEERNVGEHDHGFLQSLLIMLFGSHMDDWKVRPVAEQRVRVSETRVRIPDIAVLRAETPVEPVAVTPPLICIEIVSPDDTTRRAARPLIDYWEMGVKHAWLFDPMRQTVWVYDGELRLFQEPALVVPGTPIQVDIEALFAKFDRYARRPLPPGARLVGE